MAAARRGTVWHFLRGIDMYDPVGALSSLQNLPEDVDLNALRLERSDLRGGVYSSKAPLAVLAERARSDVTTGKEDQWYELAEAMLMRGADPSSEYTDVTGPVSTPWKDLFADRYHYSSGAVVQWGEAAGDVIDEPRAKITLRFIEMYLPYGVDKEFATAWLERQLEDRIPTHRQVGERENMETALEMIRGHTTMVKGARFRGAAARALVQTRGDVNSAARRVVEMMAGL